MINLILNLLCTFLLCVGIIFIFIELRTRFDKCFFYFGLLTVLLCFFTGIDIWILPEIEMLSEKLHWFKIQHIIACGIIPLLYVVLSKIADSSFSKSIHIVFTLSAMFTLFFLSELPFRIHNDTIITSTSYTLFFFPFCLFLFFHLSYILIQRYRHVSQFEKTIIRYHFAAMSILFFFGIFEITSFIFIPSQDFPFFVFGILLYASIITYAFTERLIRLINENRQMVTQLHEAYQNLEKANSLKQIGQCATIINHEIKNYMFIINGYAQLLKMNETLTNKGRESIQTILDTSNHMIKFSKEILDFSKAELINDKDKKRINIAALITRTIEKHFSAKTHCFNLAGVKGDHFIYGDDDKFEHVFVNLFNNALEAEADTITVSCIQKNSMLCLTIEDNGVGCDDEIVGTIFNAFFTTKKNKGGTGLGLSIVRSTIEAHGGYISAYTKNGDESGSHGLLYNIIIPSLHITEEAQPLKKHNVIIVKEGIDRIKDLFTIFQRVHFRPHIVQSVHDLKNFEPLPHYILIISDMKNDIPLNDTFYSCLYILKQCHKKFYIVNDSHHSKPQLFSEVFILHHLVES